MSSRNPAVQLRHRLRDRLSQYLTQCGVFFRGFIEHPRMVGSIIPSSGFTVRRMLAPVDWRECRLFVEYGPGIGTFCRPVLDRMSGDATLIVIDTNPLYIDHLRHTIRDKRFHAVLGSAEDVGQIVRDHGFDKADYVLSGLPFSTLPSGVGPAIVAATHSVLRPGGAFMAYQFTAAVRDLMRAQFQHIDADFEPLNILPCKLFWGWKEAPREPA
ncbi:MAG: methyltransferase [Erythrobacter sp. RIFCSPHIGHO2_12_FULL_63_10]|nr:MAG: methyltransferase [Erythrobacter sp. RIFCSPHIGHO2_12_FULL_63_10]